MMLSLFSLYAPHFLLFRKLKSRVKERSDRFGDTASLIAGLACVLIYSLCNIFHLSSFFLMSMNIFNS